LKNEYPYYEDDTVKPNVPFMKVKLLHENAIIPHRAHDTDAGLDIFNIENIAVMANSDNVIRTGISISIPNGWVAIVKEKSGRATKDKLTVGACVIDSDYRGELLIHLFNNSDIPVTFNIGEKIAQLVIVPCWCGQPEVVEELDDTDRGENRFGSTGIYGYDVGDTPQSGIVDKILEQKSKEVLGEIGTINSEGGLHNGELNMIVGHARRVNETIKKGENNEK